MKIKKPAQLILSIFVLSFFLVFPTSILAVSNMNVSIPENNTSTKVEKVETTKDYKTNSPRKWDVRKANVKERRDSRLETRQEVRSKVKDKREGLRERRTEKRSDVKDRISKRREEMKGKRCEIIANRVGNKVEKFEGNKGKQLERYQRFSGKLSTAVDKLNTKGYDTSQLASDLKELDGLVKRYASDYEYFISLLRGSQKYTCGESKGDYKSSLQEARAQLKVVRGSRKSIISFYKSNIRKDIQDLRSQRIKQKSSSNPSVTGF